MTTEDPLHIYSFTELEGLLRHFRTFGNQDGPYDFGGAIHLMLATLDNLAEHALESELEDLSRYMTPEQKAFLVQLAHWASQSTEV